MGSIVHPSQSTCKENVDPETVSPAGPNAAGPRLVGKKKNISGLGFLFNWGTQNVYNKFRQLYCLTVFSLKNRALSLYLLLDNTTH